MGRTVLLACMPWLALLVASFFVLWVLARMSRAGLDLRRLRQLHADQVGSSQSLSFVLALPVFVWVMLLIVQVSQLMIGTMIVHYAAYAAARAATVWIPADLRVEDPSESANCIGARRVEEASVEGGQMYRVQYNTASPKFRKILSAAVLACMPISPSRYVGIDVPADNVSLADSIKKAYAALAPDSQANSMIPKRIDNKLAYAMANTQIELRFFHKSDEPPLRSYPPRLQLDPPFMAEFQPNELGWQDEVTVNVNYNLPLLPGPGRLLATWQGRTAPVAGISKSQDAQTNELYTYRLTASATMGIEGEKPSVPYLYQPR